jgi:hypothetical protein
VQGYHMTAPFPPSRNLTMTMNDQTLAETRSPDNAPSRDVPEAMPA